MDRVFLDANVLFSAAYSAASALRRLWNPKRRILLTSAYALDEAGRNVDVPEQVLRLDSLVACVTIVPEAPPGSQLPEGVRLPDKDAPILLAAIDSQATHLLTGDIMHFGRLFGQRIDGVLVLRPADYLRRGSRRP